MASPQTKNPQTIRRHQTCYCRKHATSTAAEFGGEIHNVSRKRARRQVLLQAQTLHVYGSGTFGAFWKVNPRIPQKRLQENRARRCLLLSLMCIIALFSWSIFLGLESLLGNLGIRNPQTKSVGGGCLLKNYKYV